MAFCTDFQYVSVTKLTPRDKTENVNSCGRECWVEGGKINPFLKPSECYSSVNHQAFSLGGLFSMGIPKVLSHKVSGRDGWIFKTGQNVKHIFLLFFKKKDFHALRFHNLQQTPMCKLRIQVQEKWQFTAKRGVGGWGRGSTVAVIHRGTQEDVRSFKRAKRWQSTPVFKLKVI